MTIHERFGPYLKAIVGFLTPGIVALVAAVQDGSPGGAHITTAELVGIIAACFITGATVFAVPNRKPYDEGDAPDE
jgi:hypothetical protein